MLSANATIIVMGAGLVTSLLEYHFDSVMVMHSVESVVTFVSWVVWFFFPGALLSPQAKAIGYREFDAIIHYSLHLMPYVGLTFDYVAEMEMGQPRLGQAIAILTWGGLYCLWLVILYFMNGTWVYNMVGDIPWWIIPFGLLGIMIIGLGDWAICTFYSLCENALISLIVVCWIHKRVLRCNTNTSRDRINNEKLLEPGII